MPRILTTIGAGSLTTVLADGNRVSFSMPVTMHRSVLFNFDLRVCSRNGDTEPDEWQQGIRQPVHPGKVPNPLTMNQRQIHPNIYEFIDAQTGQEVHSEAIRFQIFPGYIVIALEWRYAPAQWPIRQYFTGGPMDYFHAFHQMTVFIGRQSGDRWLRPFVTRQLVLRQGDIDGVPGPPVNLVATRQSSGV